MARPTSFVSVLAALLLGAPLAGCGAGPAPTTTPAATATQAPATSPSTAPSKAASAFTLTVVPATSVGRTIPGAKVVFLVTVSGTASDGPVEITAQAPNATTTIEPAQLVPGVVGEVTLVAKDCSCDSTQVGIEIAATRAGARQTETRTLELVSGTDDWKADADAHLAPFITWLAANRPDLGITAATKWEGTPGSWVLVVNHYLYFSTDWELNLAWHVMIAPDDWSRIALRKRGSEVAPSLAFEISSVSGGTAPHEIAPPEAVWR